MESDTIAKSPGSCSVSRLWKRWVDVVKDFKKKRFGCQASKESGGGL